MPEEKQESVENEEIKEENKENEEKTVKDETEEETQGLEEIEEELKETGLEEEVKVPEQEESREEIPTEERFITIPLRKAKKAARDKRSNRAVKIIREHLARHLKRDVKISRALNQEIWKRGIKPPSKIKVKVEMTPEEAKAYPVK
ncbi:MAG: 50S ribosomal protein L31e [archaeon]